jgi:hypothetical protein
MRSDSEYDAERYCQNCKTKTRCHIVIVSRVRVDMACLDCKAVYELRRFPCSS